MVGVVVHFFLVFYIIGRNLSGASEGNGYWHVG